MLSRFIVIDLKDKCLKGKVLRYAWLPTKEIMADCLTKDMKMPSSMEAVIKGKGFVLKYPFMNEKKILKTGVKEDKEGAISN